MPLRKLRRVDDDDKSNLSGYRESFTTKILNGIISFERALVRICHYRLDHRFLWLITNLTNRLGASFSLRLLAGCGLELGLRGFYGLVGIS